VARFALASTGTSNVVHLGVVHLNDHFMARCGHLTGCGSRGEIKQFDKPPSILSELRPCKACDVHEGCTDKDRKKASSLDEELIAKYYEAYRDYENEKTIGKKS